MSGRVLQSEYMHWAKNQRPVTYALSSSEVAHFPLDRLDVSIADLELTGASPYRYRPLREAIRPIGWSLPTAPRWRTCWPWQRSSSRATRC